VRTLLFCSVFWITAPGLAQMDQDTSGAAVTTDGFADAVSDTASNETNGGISIDIEPSDDPMRPRVLFETTLGDIVIELEGEAAPITSMNFIRYVEEGFYEGTIFHRVLTDHIIQGGRFDTDLKEKTEGLREPIYNEWPNGLRNLRYTIAAARMNNFINSATSQFIISLHNNADLDQPRDGAAYCVFGKIVAGQETLARMEEAKLHVRPEYPQHKPTTPVENIVIENAQLIGDFDREGLAELAAKRQAALESAEQQRLAKMNEEIEEYVAEYQQRTGRTVETTTSGLRYAVIREGEGESPVRGDRVDCDYIVSLLDGTEVFNSYNLPRSERPTLQFPLPEGWIEGLTMMKVGGKRILIVPHTLAFKARGRAGAIPPYSSITFEVELLDITREADIPKKGDPDTLPARTESSNPFEVPIQKKSAEKKSDQANSNDESPNQNIPE